MSKYNGPLLGACFANEGAKEPQRLQVYGIRFLQDSTDVEAYAVINKGDWQRTGFWLPWYQTSPREDSVVFPSSLDTESPVFTRDMVGMQFVSSKSNVEITKQPNGMYTLVDIHGEYKYEELGENSLWTSMGAFCEWAGVKRHAIPPKPSEAFDSVVFWKDRLTYLIANKAPWEMIVDAQQRLYFLLGRG